LSRYCKDSQLKINKKDTRFLKKRNPPANASELLLFGRVLSVAILFLRDIVAKQGDVFSDNDGTWGVRNSDE
jgi:hypothetical protein